MASLRVKMKPDAAGKTPYDVATGNDADSDRHGIVTPLDRTVEHEIIALLKELKNGYNKIGRAHV